MELEESGKYREKVRFGTVNGIRHNPSLVVLPARGVGDRVQYIRPGGHVIQSDEA